MSAQQVAGIVNAHQGLDQATKLGLDEDVGRILTRLNANAVTDQDALPENTPRSNSDGDLTGPANDLATGDPSLIL